MHGITKVKKVTSTWPKDFTEIPLVCYLVTDHSGGVYTDQGESTSMVQVSLHIFAETLNDASEIADEANELMQSIGWQRVGFNHSNEKYQHIVLMYMTEVDTETETHFYT